MKIIRTLSSKNPELCSMKVKGFFGNLKGEVVYADYGINMLDGKNGYFIIVNGDCCGAATDFLAACDTLLSDLGLIKTTFV